MARVLYLRDVLELIDDGLDERSFPEQQSVQQAHQARLHLLLGLGDQFDPLSKEKIEERLRDIAFVGEDLAKQMLEQIRNGRTIIHLARGQGEVEQIAFVIDHEMQLETEEPAHAGVPTLGDAGEDLMLLDAGVVADRQVRGVHEGDAAALVGSAQRAQVAEQRDEHGGDALDEAMVADQARELFVPVLADMGEVEGLEVAVVALVEGDQDGHDLALTEAALTLSSAIVRLNQVRLEGGQELLAEVIDVAEQVQ